MRKTVGSLNKNQIETTPESPYYSSEKICKQFNKTEKPIRLRRDHSNRKVISDS